MVLKDTDHVVVGDHVSALFVVLLVRDIVAELVRQLENVLGAEAGQADEVWLEVLVD